MGAVGAMSGCGEGAVRDAYLLGGGDLLQQLGPFLVCHCLPLRLPCILPLQRNLCAKVGGCFGGEGRGSGVVVRVRGMVVRRTDCRHVWG
jgi:hypothetical protein